MNGPYFYDGSVPVNSTVSIGALWVNGTIMRFDMTSVGTSANVTTIISTEPILQLLWNASSLLNYTSKIDLQLTAPQNISIFIPAPATPSYPYTFSPTDFSSMVNPFLRVSISTDGSSYHMLQQSNLTSDYTPTFILAQYGTYQLSFICDQGTFTQMFTAQTTFSTNLAILAGSFPTTNSSFPILITQRLNSSMIGISYADSSNSTNWLLTVITHKSGSSTILDYSTNTTGNSQIILWNGADVDKSYSVNVTASVGTSEYNWIQIASISSNTNPMLGIFDFLGVHTDTLPHISTGWPDGMTSASIAQLAGSAIIVLFLSIGSFRSAGACCILSWVIAGILMYMGWWGNSTITYSTVPMFVLSGFIGLLVHFGEAKQTERE